MTQRVMSIANVLLRLGSLDPDEPQQRELREELFSDPVLWDAVQDRVQAVGYDLVQLLGHVGVRLSQDVAVSPLVTAKNNLGLDARHVRVLVYLWVQLVYRQLTEAQREHDQEPKGRTQTLFGLDESGDEDAPPTLPMSELIAEFEDQTDLRGLKGALTGLKRHGFVREQKGLLVAGSALYILLDHERMEEHVVGLARRGEATSSPEST